MSPDRVDHSPVQRVGEELGSGCGDLLYEALYVFAFLLCVDVVFTPRQLCSIQFQTLVSVAVVQWYQLPFALWLINFFIIKFVKNTVHCGQLLSLASSELAGAVGSAYRRQTGDKHTGQRHVWPLSAFGLTQFEAETNLGPVLLQRLEVGSVLSRYDDATRRLIGRRVWCHVPAGRGNGGSGSDWSHRRLQLGLVLLRVLAIAIGVFFHILTIIII